MPVIFSDDFEDIDGTPLSAHTPSGGGSPWIYAGSNADADISNIKKYTGSTSARIRGLMYHQFAPQTETVQFVALNIDDITKAYICALSTSGYQAKALIYIINGNVSYNYRQTLLDSGIDLLEDTWYLIKITFSNVGGPPGIYSADIWDGVSWQNICTDQEDYRYFIQENVATVMTGGYDFPYIQTFDDETLGSTPNRWTGSVNVSDEEYVSAPYSAKITDDAGVNVDNFNTTQLLLLFDFFPDGNDFVGLYEPPWLMGEPIDDNMKILWLDFSGGSIYVRWREGGGDEFRNTGEPIPASWANFKIYADGNDIVVEMDSVEIFRENIAFSLSPNSQSFLVLGHGSAYLDNFRMGTESLVKEYIWIDDVQIGEEEVPPVIIKNTTLKSVVIQS